VVDWFAGHIEYLSESPLLQGIVAAFCTFILEDASTVACGLLVADSQMRFLTAYIGLSSGIAIGDLGLYGLGRFAGAKTLAWRLVTADRLDRAGAWFRRNMVTSVVSARFVPGMRLPTYVCAGILHAPLGRFTVLVAASTLVQNLLFLGLTVEVGEAVLPLLGWMKWPFGVVVLVTLVVVQRYVARRVGVRGNRAGEGEPRREPVLSLFELWPPVLFYIPVGMYYVWLSIRHRSLTLPTAANPAIHSGGLINESKSQILDLVPEQHRRCLAPYVTVDVREGDEGRAAAVDEAKRLLQQAELAYPIVAKPDRGQRGAGVCVIRDDEALRAYVDHFRKGGRVMLQRLVPYRPEAGIFYYRFPGEEEGHVASMTLKDFPEVVGDGKRTLRELIDADPRARHLRSVYLARHAAQTDRVLDEGESFPLVFTGNHCQGAVFHDGRNRITPKLAARIHEIASSMPEYYFGRFDVRFEDMDALQRGEGFRVVEINGAGAEATHIWDARTKLGGAYRDLFQQFRTLFEIGAANRRRGHRPTGVWRLLKDICNYRRHAVQYPPAH
jgi:membrane protein DedA with SNARE-associated domain